MTSEALSDAQIAAAGTLLVLCALWLLLRIHRKSPWPRELNIGFRARPTEPTSDGNHKRTP